MKEKEKYNKKDYPWLAIIERPTDTVVQKCRSGKDCLEYYENLEIPSLEECRRINKKYEEETELPLLPPYIIDHITNGTKKFLQLYYEDSRNNKTGYYKMPGSMVYKIVENK